MAEKHFDTAAQLWGNQSFSDLVVRCGSRDWRLHRTVVCTASPWFHRACTGGFKESMTGAIYIEEETEHSAADLDRMFEFMYTQEYAFSRWRQRGPSPDFRLDARMYILGDYFEIPSLCAAATQHFLDLSAGMWSWWADRHTTWRIPSPETDVCTSELSSPVLREWTGAIANVYGSTARAEDEMRMAMADAARLHLATLMRYRWFYNFIRQELPEFGTDILIRSYKQASVPTTILPQEKMGRCGWAYGNCEEAPTLSEGRCVNSHIEIPNSML